MPHPDPTGVQRQSAPDSTPLRFDEVQDPEHDPELDPVRQFKSSSRRQVLLAILVITVVVILMIPVIVWVLHQPL